MEKFCRNESRIHFLFANEDDYYLDSLVKLDRNQNIYYQLKKSDYKGIYFVREEGTGLTVCTEDEQSVQQYPREMYQFFLRTYVEAEQESYHGRKIYVMRHANFGDALKRIGRLFGDKKQKHAFVLHIKTFYHICQEVVQRENIQKWISSKGQKNIFLLYADICADDSFLYLRDRQGVFCSEMFPEIRRIIDRGLRTSFYEELEVELGKRYMVWNQLGREEIRKMLMRFLLLEHPDDQYRMGRLEDYVDIIYLWHHSKSFNCTYESMFRKNENWSLRQIYENINSREIWQRMDELINQCRDLYGEKISLLTVLCQKYPSDCRCRPVFGIKSNLRRMRMFSFEGAVEGNLDLMEQIREKMNKVEEEIRTPWCTDTENCCDEELTVCVDRLWSMKSSEYFELEMIDRIMDVMVYSVCSPDRYREPEIYEKKIKYYEQIAQISELVSETGRSVRKLEAELEDFRRKISRLRNSIQEQAEANPLYQVVLEQVMEGCKVDIFSSEISKLNNDKQEMVNLGNHIRHTEKLLAVKRGQLVQYRNAIESLEITVENMTGNIAVKITDAMKQIDIEEDTRKQAIQETEVNRILDKTRMAGIISIEESMKLLDDGKIRGDDQDDEFRKLMSV